jgi:hypothetical protein
MTNISKLAFVAAVVAVGIASPALAKSFNPQFGFSAVSSVGFASTDLHKVGVGQGRQSKAANRQRGLHAFVAEPRVRLNLDPNDPVLTGGGSLGYNQNIKND